MNLYTENCPVFAFPTSIKFYLLSKETHKQLLTLYNPAESPVRFKVSCTAPKKYQVVDPEGNIGPGSCVDIVVRIIMPTQSICNQTDKFKITLLSHNTNRTLGRKVIEATLLHGERESGNSDREHLNTNYSDRGSLIDDQRSIYSNTSYGTRVAVPPPRVSYITAIILGIFCIILLLLPTKIEDQQPSSLPSYLHMSANLKIVAAYVLGLVTIVLFGSV